MERFKDDPSAMSARESGCTTIDGKYQKDPKGDHLTLCFKDEEMLAKGTHVATRQICGVKDRLEYSRSP